MAVLVRPVITEKTLMLATQHKFTFEVDRRANAIQIAQAIAGQYRVTPTDVAVINISGEIRRNRRGVGMTRRWKKAIVTLVKGQKIPGFEIETEKTEDKPKKTKAAIQEPAAQEKTE